MKRSFFLSAMALTVPAHAWGQCSALPYALSNGTVANADQVMADLNCLALKQDTTLSSGLQLKGGSIGINRSTFSGQIYDSGRYAYQIQQFGSTDPNLDRLIFQTYAPNGGGGPTPIIMDALGRVAINNNNNTNTSYTFYVNGISAGNTGWAVWSDLRLKKNVQDIGNGLDTILKLRPVRFDWKGTAERTLGQKLALDAAAHEVGFLAQDVAAVIPEAVRTPASADQPYSMIPTDIIPFLVQAIKEQQGQIKSLQDQVDLLKAK